MPLGNGHSERWGRDELDGHLAKEEMILFPLIRNLIGGHSATGKQVFHCGSVQNPIRVMLQEHDSAGEGLVQIRRLTGGYVPPADACHSRNAAPLVGS